MKKLFIYLFSFFILTITLATIYLTFFGYETSRFNKTINEIIKKNDENIDLKFDKVRVSLDVKKLSIYINLSKPELNYYESVIPLESLKADINLFSIIKNNNGINKIIVDTKYVDFKSIKPIIVRSKPGNLKTILLNNVKESQFKVNSELKFDKNLELTNESYIKGNMRNTVIDIKNKYIVRDINLFFDYRSQLLKIDKLEANFQDLKIFDSKIEYKNNNGHEINGNISTKIDTSGTNIKNFFSLTDINFENFIFEKLIAEANSNFKFKLDKTLAITKKTFNIKAEISELTTGLIKEINSNLLKENINNIHIKDTIIDISHKNTNTTFKLISYIKTSEDFFRFDLSKDQKNFTSFLVEGKNPIKIPIINYSFETGNSILTGQYNQKKNKEIVFPKIQYEINDDFFEIKSLTLNKELDLTNFKEVNVQTSVKGNINNNFSILNLKKNKILIKGDIFDAKLLAKELAKTGKNNFLKNISKEIEINLDKVLTDTDLPLKKFRLIGDIKKGKFEKISAKSEFEENKYLDIALSKEKNSNFKILEVHSDEAKPLINSYKFFNGLNHGNLIYESRFDNKISKSVLKINDFKLIEAPAFAKLLTLADFQGLTDTLKGEGISFDTLVIKFSNDGKTMRIDEIFMIGPSISILIDGYIEQESGLVSLRGTLVPAKTLNTLLSKIPIVGNILIGKKDGEGLFGVSFKIKGLPDELKTSVNPVKTLTPRFITRALEAAKRKQNSK